MRRSWLVVVAIIIILVACIGAYFASPMSGTNTLSTTSTTSTIQSIAISRAVAYLASNYNPKAGLISETSDSGTYWLYSDSYLAVLVLRQVSLSNSSLSAIAGNISATIRSYVPKLGGSTNQYMVLGSGWNGSCDFDAARSYIVAQSPNIQINVTLNNATGTLSDSDYADIAFLTAICLQHQGSVRLALSVFNMGAKSFDGIGFKDRPFMDPASPSHGQYQTYKLALYIYASELLSQPVNQMAMTTLLEMQAPDGGFYTGYYPDLAHGNTTNTETTSLAILALSN